MDPNLRADVLYDAHVVRLLYITRHQALRDALVEKLLLQRAPEQGLSILRGAVVRVKSWPGYQLRRVLEAGLSQDGQQVQLSVEGEPNRLLPLRNLSNGNPLDDGLHQDELQELQSRIEEQGEQPDVWQVATTIHRLASGARWSKYAAQLAFHGIEASQEDIQKLATELQDEQYISKAVEKMGVEQQPVPRSNAQLQQPPRDPRLQPPAWQPQAQQGLLEEEQEGAREPELAAAAMAPPEAAGWEEGRPAAMDVDAEAAAGGLQEQQEEEEAEAALAEEQLQWSPVSEVSGGTTSKGLALQPAPELAAGMSPSQMLGAPLGAASEQAVGQDLAAAAAAGPGTEQAQQPWGPRDAPEEVLAAAAGGSAWQFGGLQHSPHSYPSGGSRESPSGARDRSSREEEGQGRHPYRASEEKRGSQEHSKRRSGSEGRRAQVRRVSSPLGSQSQREHSTKQSSSPSRHSRHSREPSKGRSRGRSGGSARRSASRDRVRREERERRRSGHSGREARQRSGHGGREEERLGGEKHASGSPGRGRRQHSPKQRSPRQHSPRQRSPSPAKRGRGPREEEGRHGRGVFSASKEPSPYSRRSREGAEGNLRDEALRSPRSGGSGGVGMWPRQGSEPPGSGRRGRDGRDGRDGRGRSPVAAVGHLQEPGAGEEPPLVAARVQHWKPRPSVGGPPAFEDVLVGRWVFVSGLHPTVTDAASLKEFMQRAGGTVVCCKIHPGDYRGGCAEVEFDSPRHAAAAIEQLQGKELHGARLFLRQSHAEVRVILNSERGRSVQWPTAVGAREGPSGGSVRRGQQAEREGSWEGQRRVREGGAGEGRSRQPRMEARMDSHLNPRQDSLDLWLLCMESRAEPRGGRGGRGGRERAGGVAKGWEAGTRGEASWGGRGRRRGGEGGAEREWERRESKRSRRAEEHPAGPDLRAEDEEQGGWPPGWGSGPQAEPQSPAPHQPAGSWDGPRIVPPSFLRPYGEAAVAQGRPAAAAGQQQEGQQQEGQQEQQEGSEQGWRQWQGFSDAQPQASQALLTTPTAFVEAPLRGSAPGAGAPTPLEQLSGWLGASSAAWGAGQQAQQVQGQQGQQVQGQQGQRGWEGDYVGQQRAAAAAGQQYAPAAAGHHHAPVAAAGRSFEAAPYEQGDPSPESLMAQLDAMINRVGRR